MSKYVMRIMLAIWIWILLVIVMMGCCTLKGVLTDVGWTAERLAENIETEE